MIRNPKKRKIDVDKRKIKVKLDCSIQGMDKNFKPNGSYESIDLGKVTLQEAIDHIKMMPKRSDFPKKLLKDLKEGADVCPPAIIFSNDYYLMITTTGGEKLEIVSESFSKLAGFEFKNTAVTLDVVEVNESQTIDIVTDFFRKIDKIKKLRLGVSPLELSTLMAINNGISNSKAIASVTGSSVSDVKNAIKKLIDRDLIVSRKKGILRKKYWYELTPKGEKTLNNGKKKLDKVVKEDTDIIDTMAVAFWMMYALNEIPDSIDGDTIVDSIGEPPDTFVADVSGDVGDLDFDVDGLDFGDSGDIGGDGDWGDGDADGGW